MTTGWKRRKRKYRKRKYSKRKYRRKYRKRNKRRWKLFLRRKRKTKAGQVNGNELDTAENIAQEFM